MILLGNDATFPEKDQYSWDAQDALKHPWFDDGVDLPPLRVFKSAGGGLGKVGIRDAKPMRS